jgi:MFS family permease
VLTALAWSPGWYETGRIVQGAATGLLLVIALPPLITQFGVEKLPVTAVFVNIGLFGAVSVGPLLGGVAGTGDHWRWLMAGAAAVGGVALLLAIPTLGRHPGFDPDRSPDLPGFALAAVGCALSFLGVAQLVTRDLSDWHVWLPLAVGLVALLSFIVLEYGREDPLVPVRALSTSLPVVGTLTAMVAGAAAVSLAELAATGLLQGQHLSPARAGLLFWPEALGVVVAAAVFGLLIRTRWVPVVAFVGLAVLVGAGVLLVAPRNHVLLLAGAGLLGLGAGSTVSPGLFLAAFGVPSNTVGRAFALVELARSEAAYLVGPILLWLAKQLGSPAHGLAVSTWTAVVITAAGLLLVLVLYALSRPKFRAPDLEAWLGGDEQALHSPPTADRVRS